MLDQVRLLIDLQEIDREALELSQQMGQYPAIWEEVKTKLNALKAAVEDADHAKENHAKDRKSVEQRIRINVDALRRFQQQQTAVKTSREFEAINKQVDAAKMKINQLEEQGLGLIANDEAVDAATAITREELKNYEEFAATEKERIRLQFNDKKGRVSGLDGDRKGLRQRVEKEYITVYDRAARRHPGSAVVTVRNKSCTGCHFQLLPNVLTEVRSGHKLISCPNCSRLVSHDEDWQGVPAGAGASGESNA